MLDRFKRLLDENPEAAERLLRVMERPTEVAQVTMLDDIAEIARPLALGDYERLVVIAMNRQNKVVDAAVLSQGNDAYTIVCPRQILRWVLTRDQPCFSFALAHNHPSGVCTPSAQDREVTTKMLEAANAVGLKMLDHVVVTATDAQSAMH